ncbi:MAG: agmatinase [Sedimentisphaeraceae bacterium JB056]
MNTKLQFGDFETELTTWENSRVVILPAPFDATSTWIKGSDKGPAALLDASYNLEFYDIETDSEVYKGGIFTDTPLECGCCPEKMSGDVKAKIASYIDAGKFAVTIGGEHSVSIGAIQAHCGKYDNVTVLQLDAHSDLRQEYHGSKYNHACVMARAAEIAPILQVGIRSMDICEKPYMNTENVFFAKDIHGRTDWIDSLCSKLTENVYITIDLDAFDSSIMPSTGTPEPGGMGWWQVLTLLKAVAQKANIVGFDIVELCPNEHNKAPDFLAAKLLYKLLTYKFEL